tara:strand:+ start:2376 stop:3572 length:1197 start_codon:yes stop_codon:yes gene_type:complete
MSRLITNSIRSTSASADAITFDGSGNATFPANITCSGTATGFGGGRAHNLIINGAMQVAQRGTSFSGTAQQYTLDRMQINTAGNDEIAQTEQAAVTSGGAYTAGFRKCLKIINGNQTSGAGATDFVHLKMVLEAQDIANSGWNYTSSSSNVTLSFWVKSSVAQDFPITLRSEDGTRQVYNMTTGSLSADTWTKVSKTIPGNSNLQFDDNVNAGLTLFINAFVGTDYTTGSLAQNAWSAWDSAKQGDNMTSTWYTTNDATLEITGLLLEVADSASDYPHLSYADELLKCQRYCIRWYARGSNTYVWMGQSNGSDKIWGIIKIFPVQMRAEPTATISGNYYPVKSGQTVGGTSKFTTFSFTLNSTYELVGTWSGAAGIDTDAVVVFTNNTANYIEASAEL